MTQNREPIAPALREATAHARIGLLADGWLAPPVVIPILISLAIIARSSWPL